MTHDLDQPYFDDNTGLVAACVTQLDAERECVPECHSAGEMHPVDALRAIHAISGFALAEEKRRQEREWSR